MLVSICQILHEQNTLYKDKTTVKHVAAVRTYVITNQVYLDWFLKYWTAI